MADGCRDATRRDATGLTEQTTSFDSPAPLTEDELAQVAGGADGPPGTAGDKNGVR